VTTRECRASTAFGIGAATPPRRSPGPGEAYVPLEIRTRRATDQLRDLIELNGDDLRREPLDTRKATLASVLRRAASGLRLNEHIEADGSTVFAHACKMGLEGIVSKRKDSPYRSGRSPDWLKSKNPACEAVRREAEEDWGGQCLASV